MIVHFIAEVEPLRRMFTITVENGLTPSIELAFGRNKPWFTFSNRRRRRCHHHDYHHHHNHNHHRRRHHHDHDHHNHRLNHHDHHDHHQTGFVHAEDHFWSNGQFNGNGKAWKSISLGKNVI